MKLWIAKDDDGRAYIYTQEPKAKINGKWGGIDSANLYLIPNEIDGELQEIDINV